MVREIVARSCHDGDADHVKALFLLLRQRLAAVKRASDVRAPVFLGSNTSRLVEFHDGLRRKALASAELAHLEHDSLAGFKAFCSRERLRGADLEQMAHIPPAIQRKLGRDGSLPDTICNAGRDRARNRHVCSADAGLHPLPSTRRCTRRQGQDRDEGVRSPPRLRRNLGAGPDGYVPTEQH
jgi:hypothetical protein